MKNGAKTLVHPTLLVTCDHSSQDEVGPGAATYGNRSVDDYTFKEQAELAIGRHGLTPSDAMRGTFRPRSLRNVATSAPFMYAGQFPTLSDAIVLYNQGDGNVIDGATKDPRLHPRGLIAHDTADLWYLLQTFRQGGARRAALTLQVGNC